MIHHVPNIISLFRLALTPVLLVLILSQTMVTDVLALIVFAVASISDWLDGRVARVYKVGSRVGQFLDPLADKVLIIGTLLVLPLVAPAIPFWAVILIAVRDIGITVLRIWQETNGSSLSTTYLAKVKTTLQMIFVTFVVILLVLRHAADPVGPWARQFLDGSVLFSLLLLVVALTLYTGFDYLRATFQRGSVEVS